MFRGKVNIKEIGTESDQLILKILYPNIKIAEEYLNTLVNEFDKDGIKDKQLQYKNTIEFVDTRSVILSNELEQIELRKQNFKQSKNLSDLKSDASLNIQEQYQYNSELFKAESQKTLAKFLEETISKQEFKLLPVNIGFENPEINLIINEFNQLVKERDKYLVYAGTKNSLVLSIEKQLENYFINISNSIQNFIKSLDIKISALENKESQYMDIYSNIPENEKILRSIDRELSIKEALFLLLLQKKEEASINFAVVKPTIKIIDLAITPKSAKSPDKMFSFIISIVVGFLIPFSFLYILFFFDNKIHTKDHLLLKTKKKIKVIGEVPHILDDNELNEISNSSSRSPLSESIRMITANLNFSFIGIDDKCKTILVTSSVKGEGKTLISVNTAGILCTGKNKVLLIGSDLRNPQIHKFLNKEKNILGLSDILYKNDIDNYKDYINKKNDLDIILSGTIPPNPTELLSHSNFELLIDKIKKEYDYIVIDSAPCLMVSDTLEISKLVDSSIYVVRANYTENKLCDFILENFEFNRINNMNLVLNDVGVSSKYGYKYGYQYGYQYGYRYGYNYGYGYGYSEDS